ncbi:MAG: DNA methylase [Candidatus Handelsmanbacteria bacterium RIFCSPLOWO2_12_FULL_64_10]|uniref:Methyltransferase n=1 Tax=Handelsmanbacteria sp. (strain RIFCSPLOWO2_12_FULL_64_10) TaxID=1817868 RepID=A0A1F6CB14_HANXR|nr:MAG: DNA methylase [Candidatus Handelsmanbacteria bacterium RIFCSPLOWO2_12_FULL_64_10]
MEDDHRLPDCQTASRICAQDGRTEVGPITPIQNDLFAQGNPVTTQVDERPKTPRERLLKISTKPPRVFRRTRVGTIYLGNALRVLTDEVRPSSVDLIVTSPPFGLVRKKSYGNVDADQYVEWFRPFGEAFRRVLKPTGSLVIDIGGAWIPGQPTRSLYHYELLIMLCRKLGFHLAQEFFWWNPSRLPSPAEWVTVRRIRVKDAVDCVWWLSPTPWPKASNRRVLMPYSDAMKGLLKTGYRAKLRPSGHDISEHFAVDNGAAISPNLIAVPNTESNSYYLRYCNEKGLPPHPARFPAVLPEYFIRMLTDQGDLVIDPFAGSCVTGEVAERLDRKWICCEIIEDYLLGAMARFDRTHRNGRLRDELQGNVTGYKISHPGAAWGAAAGDPLAQDGGRRRRLTNTTKAKRKSKTVRPRASGGRGSR